MILTGMGSDGVEGLAALRAAGGRTIAPSGGGLSGFTARNRRKPDAAVTKVLVAEDSPTQAADLKMILESDGFAVEIARDGLGALERFRAEEFDIVMTDVVMPGLTGYELCQRIKADPRGGSVPVILLTTLTDPEDIMQGLASGADNFIPKPYKPDHLLSRVRGILANRCASAHGSGAVAFRFMGKTVAINQDRQQIIGLLISSFEEAVRRGEELRESRAQVERYARELEARIRVSEDKYRVLVEGASDAILVLDPRGKILEANRRAEELFGRGRPEILGRRFQDFVPSSAGPSFLMVLLSGSGEIEGCIRRPDGAIRFVDLSLSTIDLGTEKVAIGIARDVTERHRAADAEEQVRQAQKMDALGRLAGGVAHDFNNYLSVIRGGAEMLLADIHDDSIRENVADIIAAADRSAELTRQLLAFGRRQPLVVEVIDLNDSVRKMERLLRRTIPADIALEVRLSDAPVAVKADRGQIEQVILNLAVNARDAMRAGKLPHACVLIETSNVDEHVCLTVADTGEGMDAETQTRIFEPFFTTKEIGKGTGLGLATVYGIVKQTGGDIAITSARGNGTTFNVYLPRSMEVPSERPIRRVVVQRAEIPRTILLVEDQAPLRAVARRILGRAGHRVIEASGGDEAISLAEKTDEIHLLFTDIMLPGMSGPDLYRVLAERHPEMKVLFMSGYSEQNVGTETFPFLRKPFAMTELTEKIREALYG